MKLRLAATLVNLTNEVSETNAKLASMLEKGVDEAAIVAWLEHRLDGIARTAEAERARLERLL